MPTIARPTPLLDSLWRASEMGTPVSYTTPSGYAGLDAELPGNGWPAGQLSEVLQAQAGLHEWRLLVPAVRAAARSGAVVLIGCPHWPNMAALAGQGIAMPSVLLVEAERPVERLWAAEQALRCRDLSALLVWLPQARPEQLRRLQLACQAAHQPRPPLAFVFRPQSVQHESSPAPLRLSLRLSPWQETPGAGQQASSELEVHIFKRRGPVQETPLRLHTALPPVLALRRAAAVAPSVASFVRVTSSAEQGSPASAAIVALPIAFTGTPHVVDRARAPADSVQARA